ncbi:Protein of unknown function [Modestobacter sp. DSM 44400]|uniref:DUF3311 domain-containing protein n=1 Tax=Modestobacter sp. DSM 44400 TaxID=1550230 RepID=UPI00089C221E|nr:DUF3311 domain-containing protein [Modestobacter sp. DSM 44400]SDY51107.1 Protein of unknown function [Modestobacter sp. DSM 44400]
MSSPDAPPAGVAPRRSDRSPWNWLLVLPVVVPLLVPLFNRIEPTLFGWPFFYWFQLLMVALGVGTTSIVYLVTKRSKTERLAAGRSAERDEGR